MPKKMMKKDACTECSCDHSACHHSRGKALVKIAIGLLLISYGFGYIDIRMLGLVLGALYCLMGIVKMMQK